jgi:hypothetical protein
MTLIGVLCVTAGAVLSVIGWWQISGESVVAKQLPYLASASIPGAALVIAGAVLIASRGRAATDARIDRLYRLLTEIDTDTVPVSEDDVEHRPAR